MHRAALLALSVLAACTTSSMPPTSHDPVQDREALMAADRAFADSTAARGLDGWMSFFASDAVRLEMGGDFAQGLDAIRSRDSTLMNNPDYLLRWEPANAGTFADGTHGFTTGHGELVRRGPPGDTAWSGRYVTIWRRDTDGRWRVILDTGS